MIFNGPWKGKKPDEWYDENRWVDKGKLPTETIKVTKITIGDWKEIKELDLIMCFKLGNNPKELFSIVTYRNGERV